MVLDVMLPGKDGFAVATELRKASNYIPLLMLTARGSPEDVLKGFESAPTTIRPSPSIWPFCWRAFAACCVAAIGGARC